jgi:hypothetical protein
MTNEAIRHSERSEESLFDSRIADRHALLYQSPRTTPSPPSLFLATAPVW